MFNRARSAAKSRGLEWTVTVAQFEELRKNPCYYCGGELPEAGHGLDRVENCVGYVIENVVPCCASCNVKKGADWTTEETKAAILAVCRIRESKDA